MIADEIWAKLLWAGLNLRRRSSRPLVRRHYPPELVRAITLTWLFSGPAQRRDRPAAHGCIRWQHDGTPLAGDSARSWPRDAVCLLDVPVNKTGTAFTKPVDPLLGQAIEAWQAARPAQPRCLDRKTGEQAAFLFAFRARRVSKNYINNTIIPMLCAQGRRSRRRCPRQHHQPPGPLDDRQPALQRQGTDDAVRAAGLARAYVPGNDPALREDHPEHADQGLPRRRLLRPQHPHHRSARSTATP